jgi:ATP-binding cassette subfamily F protein 3
MQYIKVNKGKQSMANAVKNRTRDLEKMKASKDWMDPPPRLLRRIKFHFPEPPAVRRGSARRALLASMNQVTHGYGDGQDEVLFEEATMSVEYGNKIGIVGGNGVGKSTLLRILMGHEKPKSGSVLKAELHENCYFTQHQADLLPQHITTLEAVEEANGLGMSQKDLTEIMSKFRFKGKRLNVKVGACSGGEKARLAIVRMMLTPSQILVLDEPTNHLDVTMKETLEYSLREFPGAAVIVSHDRYFLSQTCRSILEVKDGQVRVHKGDFRSYMESDRELRKQIESRYSGSTAGILPLQVSQEELKKQERGGLQKYRKKRMIRAEIAARNAPAVLLR